jgi:transforming growth factor-beta-induced protein
MWKTVLVLVVVLLMGASVATASGHETIVDIAAGNDNFDTLVAAVVAADLADALSGGSWTVFAPTDAAFAKLGLNADNIASSFTTAELTDILLYHVLPAPVSSAEAKASVGDIVMGNGQKAGLKFFDGSLYVNDDAKVIAADIVASNGVIHVVDTVILGPWPRSATGAPAAPAARPAGNTIVDIAVGNGNFDTLVAAVVAAGLADALSSGSWTVFAPTDAAFAKLPAGASDDLFRPENRDKLVRLLQYHVVPGRVPASEIARLKPTATVAGVPLPFSIRVRRQTGAQVNGDLQAGSARIVRADIECTNGMIHVIDTVLEPPA